MQFPCQVNFFLFYSNVLLYILFSKTLCLCLARNVKNHFYYTSTRKQVCGCVVRSESRRALRLRYVDFSGLYRRSWTSLPTPVISAQQLSEITVLFSILTFLDSKGKDSKHDYVMSTQTKFSRLIS
jgi:hypothetical protein